MHRPARHPLHDALGSFLEGYQWAHFHTLTFRRESGEEYARREWKRYLRLLTLEAGVPLQWFYGIEHGERFGRVHIHALTGNTERLPRDVMAEQWRAGHSRIVPYEPGRGASHYIAKYVTKEMAEWDISGALRASSSLPLAVASTVAASDVAAFRAPAFRESQRLAMRARARGAMERALPGTTQLELTNSPAAAGDGAAPLAAPHHHPTP